MNVRAYRRRLDRLEATLPPLHPAAGMAALLRQFYDEANLATPQMTELFRATITEELRLVEEGGDAYALKVISEMRRNSP